MTSNDKIEHKALEAAFLSTKLQELQRLGEMIESNSSNVQCWSDKEKALRRAVAEFWGIGQNEVSRTTSFRRLGIDSLSAIRLVRQLRKLLDFAGVTVRDLLRWSSIARSFANFQVEK